MSSFTITIVDAETGEVITREMTSEEIEQLEKQQGEIAAEQEKANAKQTARLAILDKLGITADEAKLLLGGN